MATTAIVSIRTLKNYFKCSLLLKKYIIFKDIATIEIHSILSTAKISASYTILIPVNVGSIR